MKRMIHRNANVQPYSLALVESLSKNCGKDVHSEIASRAFTQALDRLITDRVRVFTSCTVHRLKQSGQTTHDRVRQKALTLIGMWAAEFESDPTLGLMEECYDSLKAKSTPSCTLCHLIIDLSYS